MALLEHHKAIREYYHLVKDQYPELDHYQFEKVCKAPWLAIKKWMADPYVPLIHIKYFGKIMPSASNIKKVLKKLEYCKERIPHENYQSKKQHLESILERLYYEENPDDLEWSEAID